MSTACEAQRAGAVVVGLGSLMIAAIVASLDGGFGMARKKANPEVTAAEHSDNLAAAVAAHRVRQYAQAADHYGHAAQAGADPVMAMGGQAECLFYLGDYDGCTDLCQQLASTVPSCGRAAHLLGLVCLKTGRTGEALDHFRRAARWGERAALLHLRGE